VYFRVEKQNATWPQGVSIWHNSYCPANADDLLIGAAARVACEMNIYMNFMSGVVDVSSLNRKMSNYIRADCSSGLKQCKSPMMTHHLLAAHRSVHSIHQVLPQHAHVATWQLLRPRKKL